ncbi:hypothetical protein A5784_23660 [Mycobacterium sp. 852013-50091_SCH5140682]|uniref:hypothetical protein n=1 Tax=Mycobacterium sp. 852013-50091_SCH5140682 TaxID=1834109 RepID=UPI0007EBC80D|nr:hypothetical protein [Mycobacterium sp. 852013-50091_SCH5140682]OBC17403.1 hypothetical protein A5784_23660 [Mycobacterium sp. 852013-50091_SCH5140682]
MSNILLQTTIPATHDDWDVSRFSLLAAELRAAGHDVTARNRACDDDDPVLRHLDEGEFDQLWLLAVDVGDGLTETECAAIGRFRARGGGVLTARDHQQLGSCLRQLGSLGTVNQFHDEAVDPATMCDDQDNPDISWPNYHSGANGDYQPVFVDGSGHELLRTTRTASGRIEWFPAHPHEGLVALAGPHSQVLAQGRSTSTGRRFNLAVLIDGERAPDGRPLGRALAVSTFHHFADYNWDIDCGAPTFVTEAPGDQIKSDPARLDIFKDYVRNIAVWLTPAPR